MNIEEVRALNDEEIRGEIEKHREEWRNLRFQDALGRLTTFHRIREVRASIARLKTVLTERQIAVDPAAHYATNDRKRARRRVAGMARRQAERKLARKRR